ncbi:MAG: response regulator transcription factor, partial [Desulfobacterales bacterium]|nr:response regulator transcription factor [Desulfobacterales bacterium]
LRRLLADGSPPSLEKAGTDLQNLLRLNRAGHNLCQQIQLLPLLSLARVGQHREEEALDHLERAVHLGEPGGWIRPFVDAGPGMADLLQRLQARNGETSFTRVLLAVFKESGCAPPPAPAAPTTASPAAPPRPSAAPSPLVEELTNREMDVLELLAKRFQTKEIGDKLCISKETVKSHLKNIYGKLSVNKGREAVKKAREIGLL